MGVVIALLLAASIPLHVPTWAYDQDRGQARAATAAQIQRYVTYAEGGLDNDKALRDCGGSSACSSVFYFNPGLVYASGACPYPAYREFLSRAREDWFVHERGYGDAAHRVAGTYQQSCRGTRVSIPVYVANQANPEVAAFFGDYLRRVADRWQFYLADDTSDTVISQFYGPGGGFCANAIGRGWCSSTEEQRDNDAVAASHLALAAALRHANGVPMQLFYNGMTFADGAPQIPPLLARGRFAGVVCENCVVSDGALRPAMYARVLDAMARVARIPNASFVLLSSGSSASGSSAQLAARTLTTAIAWLGFDDARTILWPNLEDRSGGLAIWPEDTLYPTQPLQTMGRSSADLLVAPGVWRREFAACYRESRSIGPCAAIVNGSNASVTIAPSWLRGRYAHMLVPSGGDVLAGGSLSTAPYAPGSVQLAPGQALLLAS